MIYADFESNLVPENNEKQIGMSLIQTNIKNMLLPVMVITQQSVITLFKSYLGEDAVYNFINSMVRKSKYCNDMMKKHFVKELMMARKDIVQGGHRGCKSFKNSKSCKKGVFLKVSCENCKSSMLFMSLGCKSCKKYIILNKLQF